MQASSLLLAKLIATCYHGLISVFVSIVTALFVFFLWFPNEFSQISKGTGLFLLIVSVEVVLGPLMSLVIYNPGKRIRELLLDYSIVGALQAAALGYGLITVAQARPVYMVFVMDRVEVVSVADLSPQDVEDAADGFRVLPWLGPRLICVAFPEDGQAKADLILSALSGKDIHLLPKYYRECEPGEIVSRAKDQVAWGAIANVKRFNLPDELNGKDFHWLPVVAKNSYWTVFFRNGDTSDRIFLHIDSF